MTETYQIRVSSRLGPALCSAFADITGAVLTGLAPLMLAYLLVAALASLLAAAPENTK